MTLVLPAAPLDVSPSAYVIRAGAYKRSWFVSQLLEHEDSWFFAGLLREVAPEKYQALADRTGLACYRALWAHVNTLVPLAEIDFDWLNMLANEQGETPLHALREEGIPIFTRGCEAHELYYSGYDDEVTDWASAVALHMFAVWGKDRDDEEISPLPQLFQRLPRALRSAQLERYLHAGLRPNPKAATRPPRGRTWRAPWDGLGDFVDWVYGGTGSSILDYSHEEVMEMGGFPGWSAAEIRGFARDWKQHAPVWKRIDALRDHLAQRPAERLLQLAGALAGDKNVRQQLSEAKPQPLWKQFSRTPHPSRRSRDGVHR